VASPAATASSSPSPFPSQTSTVTASPTAAPPTAQTLPTHTSQPGVQVCSPLAEITLAQTGQMISNPYHPPPVGSDDPHHGVDLADRLPDSQVAVAGRAVQAVLAGQVAAVIQNRFPYGNAILIETALDAQNEGQLTQINIPTLAPTPAAVSPLTCPPAPETALSNSQQRSFYLLYAHLDQPPGLRVGDSVPCGRTIGAVGSSGNALNPHLHFEARIGPSGLRLTSMAHYDASASADEMGSYCLWRISGLFQLIDPLQILEYQN